MLCRWPLGLSRRRPRVRYYRDAYEGVAAELLNLVGYFPDIYGADIILSIALSEMNLNLHGVSGGDYVFKNLASRLP